MLFNRKNIKEKRNFLVTDNRLMLKMVTSYSVFLLIIIVLGIFLYTTAMKNVKNTFLTQNRSLLKNSVELMDKDLQIMEVFSRQLLQNSDFWSTSSNQNGLSREFQTAGLSLKEYLSNNIYPNTLLHLEDFYIYFKNSNRILSPNVFTARNMFYSHIKNYTSTEYEMWTKQLDDSEFYEKMLIMDRYISVPNNHFYLYIMDLNNLTYRRADATISFILNEQKIADLFSEIDFYKSGYLIVFDDDNEVMFSLNEWNKDKSATPVSINMSKMQNLKFTNNHTFYKEEDGTKMLVSRVFSGENSWTYYLVQPENAAYAGVESYQFIYTISLALAFIFGMFLIFVISRRNVAPIVKLDAQLQVVSKERTQLLEVVDKQKPIITQSYIQKLMTGSVSTEDEYLYIKNFLELGNQELSYNVIYIVAYNNSENAGEFGNDVNLSPEEFDEIMDETLRNNFGSPFLCYAPTTRTYALLLNTPMQDKDNLIMKAQERIVHLHNALLNEYGIWMFAGIGRTTNSLMNVWESYQQASEAISYTTKNYIFFPYEILKKDSNTFYYPPELSAKLIHFITVGNKSQVLELFSMIHQENIEERSLPINLLQFLLQDIRNTMLKARFSLPTGLDADVIEALDARFNEHLSFKLCEDIALGLCELFHSGSKDNNLATTIELYIKKNYKDSSLCLNKISDEFQISESYFSHMFKEKTSVNFSTYLENIRMREASRLIQETNINLSDLYMEVGYNNPTTFRRVFKKTFGVTPSSMLEANLNKSQPS